MVIDWLCYNSIMNTQLLQHLAATNSGLSIVPAIIGLAAFAFEIYMLIDAIRNPIKNKVVWILVIILVGFIGAVIYNFFGRNKLES